MNIVHLTAHMSGGLTEVLLSTLKHSRTVTPNIQRRIICLGQITKTTKQLFAEYSQHLVIAPTSDGINHLLSAADIIQIEWWNHPLIYDFLNRCDLPLSRILVCCHISGFHRPQILTREILQLADIFVGATEATRQHPLLRSTPSNEFSEKLRFVQFPIDTDTFSGIRSLERDSFNIGYVGTVNYSKMHRNFLGLCSKINISGAKFTIVGATDVDNIETESKQYIATTFSFEGYQKNVGPFLEKMHVFGYPLQPTHFGSGELVILEAMYFGIPVVAFSNKAESAIIKNNVTGLLVNTEDEYVSAVEYLYHNPEEGTRIGKNARTFVSNLCEENTAMTTILNLYEELLQQPKTRKSYGGDFHQLLKNQPETFYGANLFIQSLGDTAVEFRNSVIGHTTDIVVAADKNIANIEIAMKTKTKGSLFQYWYFFPDDPYLNLWAGLVKQREGDDHNAVAHFQKAALYGGIASRAKNYLHTSARRIP